MKTRYRIAHRIAACSNPLFYILFSIFFIALQAQAQDLPGQINTAPAIKDVKRRTVSGRLSAADGQAIPGAFVFALGREKAVFTSDDGTFSLDMLATDTVLVGQAQGYLSQEAPLQDTTTHADLTLRRAPATVMTAFGPVLESQNYASIATLGGGLSGPPLANLPYANLETGLQGRFAGLYAQQGSGVPGSGAQVRIRQAGLLLAGSEPLYIVDGMPVTSGESGDGGGVVGRGYGQSTSPLSWINPYEIDRIEVLKDAAALAPYGVRGANGVVLITTRRGQPGKTRFTLSFQQGVKTALGQGKRKPLSGLSLLAAYNQAATNSYGLVGQAPPDPTIYIPLASGEQDSILNLATAGQTNTNFQKVLLRPASFSKLDFSASAGDNRLTFYTNLSYLKEQSVLKGGDLQRVSLRFNAENVSSSGAFRIGINTVLGIGEEYITPAGQDTTAGYGQARRAALTFFPERFAANDPRQPYNDNVFFNAFSGANTTALAQRSLYFNERKTFRNVGSVYAALKLLPGMELRSEVGFDYYNNVNREYRSRFVRRSFAISASGDTAIVPTAGASDFRQSIFAINWQNTLRYTYTFTGGHNVHAIAGTSTYRSTTKFNGVSSELFPNDYSPLVSNGSRQVGQPLGSESGFVINGAFAQAGYAYQGRYLVDYTARGDRSSRFGPDFGTAYSQALSLGWQLSKEGWFDTLGVLSFVKLRATSGVVGNATFGNELQKGYVRGGDPYILAAFQGQFPLNLANRRLAPEKHFMTDLGLDAVLFGGRLAITLDAWRRKVEQVLQGFTLPASIGTNSLYYPDNGGILTTQGLEAALSGVHVESGRFSWSSTLTSTWQVTKVTDLGPVREASGAAFDVVRQAQGQRYGTYFLVEYAGQANADDPQGRYKRGDELILGQDGVPFRPRTLAEAQGARRTQTAKTGLPSLYGGWQHVFRYGDFDLSALLTWATGQYVYDKEEQQLSYLATGKGNLLASTTSGGNIYLGGPASPYQDPLALVGSTRFLHNASYGRLRQVQIGYTLPSRAVRALRVQGGRLFIQADNLAVVTSYKGADPEFAAAYQGALGAQGRNLGSAIYSSQLPQVRTFTVGLSATF